MIFCARHEKKQEKSSSRNFNCLRLFNHATGRVDDALGSSSDLCLAIISVIPFPAAQHAEAGEFLQTLDDHDDVHLVWAAVK